jgi:Transglycosylase-like domain
VLSRKTAVVAAGAAVVAVPVAVATAQDNDAAPVRPALAPVHGAQAAALADRSRANVVRDGALVLRGQHAHHALVNRNVELARKLASARDRKVAHDLADRVGAFSRPRLRAENAQLAHQVRKLAGSTAGGGSTASPQLEAIAACESGGDPHSIGGGGAFRGKYQFTYGTWASVGGSGDPASAPEAEQDKRAQMLLEKSGSSPWPVCGQ